MTQKKPRIGRGRKSKAVTISVYFDDVLHSKIKARAARLDHSLSQHLRLLARQDIAQTS